MEKLTPGKLAGLKAVSDHRGVIAAAAMDQRGSLQKSLAKERGTAADAHDLEEFKTLVTSVLTKHATGILLDPEYGLPASKHRNGKGLFLAYEKTGYDAPPPAACPTSSTSGASVASKKLGPTVSRSSSITPH